MIDGTVARRTNSASEFGARLDTVSDFVFMTVALIKFVPHLPIHVWLWIWIGVIAMIKIGNAAWGFVHTKELISPHTLLNKITGLLLFFLPMTLGFVGIKFRGEKSFVYWVSWAFGGSRHKLCHNTVDKIGTDRKIPLC